MGVKGEISGRGKKKKASYVRRKGSREQSEGDGDVGKETAGPRGSINEAIDLSVQRSSAVLSLSSLIYPHHQHGMDFLLCIFISVISMDRRIKEEQRRRRKGKV
ncbi:hypothetical protein PBY51_002891 [Eleginops maclovinus]|uniref:Uncharacterized protein n=1 Tax=Eleginops maclovinus TaxID=56733 RepID=A0AAN8ADJ6_ELEMC|nr:hypothetical protein PBY51_002891 [Eleginops maclovinus]